MVYPYASRVYLRVWLNEKKKKWVGVRGYAQEGFRSQYSHNGRFVRDGISLGHKEGQDYSFPAQARSPFKTHNSSLPLYLVVMETKTKHLLPHWDFITFQISWREIWGIKFPRNSEELSMTLTEGERAHWPWPLPGLSSICNVGTKQHISFVVMRKTSNFSTKFLQDMSCTSHILFNFLYQMAIFVAGCAHWPTP